MHFVSLAHPFARYLVRQSSTYKQHLRNKHPSQSEGLMFSCFSCCFKTVNEDIYRLHQVEHSSATAKLRKNSPPSRSDQDSSTRSSSCDSPSSSGCGFEQLSAGTLGNENSFLQLALARGILGGQEIGGAPGPGLPIDMNAPSSSLFSPLHHLA